MSSSRARDTIDTIAFISANHCAATASQTRSYLTDKHRDLGVIRGCFGIVPFLDYQGSEKEEAIQLVHQGTEDLEDVIELRRSRQIEAVVAIVTQYKPTFKNEVVSCDTSNTHLGLDLVPIKEILEDAGVKPHLSSPT
eukprot:scaffold2931_cov204-Alexandrium_tamarense.AAC.29